MTAETRQALASIPVILALSFGNGSVHSWRCMCRTDGCSCLTHPPHTGRHHASLQLPARRPVEHIGSGAQAAAARYSALTRAC